MSDFDPLGLPPTYLGFPDPWEKRRKRYETHYPSAVPEPSEPRPDTDEEPTLPEADPNLIDTITI